MMRSGWKFISTCKNTGVYLILICQCNDFLFAKNRYENNLVLFLFSFFKTFKDYSSSYGLVQSLNEFFIKKILKLQTFPFSEFYFILIF